MRWDTRQSLGCATLALLLLVVPAGLTSLHAAPPPKDYGSWNPYSIGFEALKGSSATDVTVSLRAEEGFSVPALAQKILLKTYDSEGNVVWARNYHNVALTDGRVQYSFADLSRHQPLTVKVNVKTGESVNMEVLEAETRVLLRPDLVIASVNVPSQALVGQPVNIEVVVLEANGDLGADFALALYEGSAELDRLTGAGIAAGGVASGALTVAFSSPGVHTLTARIEDATPGEYDTSNNEAQFQVTVDGALEPLWYSLAYKDYYSEYEFHTTASWGSYHLISKGDFEYLNYSVMTDTKALAWPIDQVALSVYADGGLVKRVLVSNLWASQTSSWTDGSTTWSYKSHWTSLGDNDFLYALTSSSTGAINGQYTSVSYNRYASDYVYFSSGHTQFWSWSTDAVVHLGTFLHATARMDTKLVVTDDGAAYGGWSAVLVSPYTIGPTSFTYSDPSSGLQAWGSYFETGLGGSGSGITSSSGPAGLE